jgi:DNA repair photolyase
MPLKTVTGNPAGPHKGRGATLNPEGRFESLRREGIDDGWDAPAEDEPAKPRTTVTPEHAKSIITRNDSPDVPFTYSINPYRGCEHGCVYCLAGDTPILMSDGTLRAIQDLRPGDVIFGTTRVGWYRRYVRTRVLAHWRTIKPAYRIVLADGTSVVAGGDHRFLTERGWKFVSERHACDGAQRPHLTTNNKLMGTGRFAPSVEKNNAYKSGYLCGVIRGDGHIASYRYQRLGRTNGDQHQFRLALCDAEALERTQTYLREWEIDTQEFVFQAAAAGRREMRAVRTSARSDVETIRELIRWPENPEANWCAGFLAGIFDAEGSFSQGVLRISNTDAAIIEWIRRSLHELAFRYCIEHQDRTVGKPISVVRLDGRLREQLRFLHTTDPAITRKREISGKAVKGDADLRVTSVEPLGKAMALYDITTETGDFIANGLVSHNCYARPSHAYLELSPGLDFETRLFAKVNAAEVLRDELARPGHKVEPIAIGVNTDCYQPIEREYRITRQVLEVLAECEHPCTIVTKNALVERDLDLLVSMAQKNLVQVFVSVTSLDGELARRMEPRASAPHRRLQAIRMLSAAGVPVGAMVAPVIPFLNDSEVEPILQAVREAGAESAGYVLMRLPWELKELFKDWLQHNYPLKAAHVMSRVREMRGGRENDPQFGSRMRGQGLLADLLRKRFDIACERLGLNRERRAGLDCTRFKPPRRGPQLDLF